MTTPDATQPDPREALIRAMRWADGLSAHHATIAQIDRYARYAEAILTLPKAAPTPPDLSLLRKGVRFTAEFECFYDHKDADYVGVAAPHGIFGGYARTANITAIHAPAQVAGPAPERPIAVGDRVRDENGIEGDVIALHYGEAWIFQQDRGGQTRPVRRLTRVAPADVGA